MEMSFPCIWATSKYFPLTKSKIKYGIDVLLLTDLMHWNCRDNWSIAFRLVIVLNSHDAIKEAFVHRGSDFADRPKFGAGAQLINFNDGKTINCFLSKLFPF